MLRRRWNRKMLERNRRVAVVHLLRDVKATPPGRKEIQAEIRAAAAGAGYALEVFGELLWPDRKQSEAVRDFLQAGTAEPEGMVPAHRVATWTLLVHRHAIGRPDALDEVVRLAADSIGIRNEQERWIANFGPIPDPQDESQVGENPHAKFIFGSCDRMLEATIGREVTRNEAASATLAWSGVLADVGMPEQDAELEHNHLAGLT